LPENTPNKTTIIENNRITIPCPVRGTPAPQVTWYKDGDEITGNEIGVQILADGSLQLDRAQADDSGTYICFARNVAGNLSHIIELDVFCEFINWWPEGDCYRTSDVIGKICCAILSFV